MSDQNVRVQFRHDSVAPVLTDDFAFPRVDASAIILVNPGGVPFPVTVTDVTPSVYNSAGDAISGLIGAAGARLLREIKATNVSAGNRYLQLHNVAALPANGAVPYWTASLILSANDHKEVFNPKLAFTVGCFWVFSSTRTTLTVVVANDANVSALYE